jgi:Acetyltransferases
MVEIKYVEIENKSFWSSLDKDLSEKQFEKKIKDKEGYVLYLDHQPIGILRYNLFWDHIPFCTFLFISHEFQGKGYGKRLMEHWESDMRKQGYHVVLTSTQVNENAQHFYRNLGYKDCGGMIIDVKGYEQPMELFMIKTIEIDSMRI